MAKKPAKKTVKKSTKKPAKKGVKKTIRKKPPVKMVVAAESVIAIKEQKAAARDIKLFSVVKNSFDIAVKNFWELMFLLFLPSACFLIGYLPAYKTGAETAGLDAYNWPFIIAGYLIGVIAYIMVFVVIDRRDKGLHEKSAGEYARENLSGAAKRLPAVLLIGLLFFLVIAVMLGVPTGLIVSNLDNSGNVILIIALILLVILFVFFMLAIMLVYGQAVIIAITRPGIKNPIAHSAKITKGKRWKILVLFCLLWLIVMSVELMALIPIFIMGALTLTFLPLLALVGIIYMVFMMAVNVFNNAFYFALFRALEDSYWDKNITAASGK